MNIRIKRIIAGFIDLYIISLIGGLMTIVMNKIVSIAYRNDIVISNISNIIIPILTANIPIIIETIIYKGKSIGKKIVGIYAIYKTDSLFIVFLGRLINMTLWQFSFITILLFNKTISDLLFDINIYYEKSN